MNKRSFQDIHALIGERKIKVNTPQGRKQKKKEGKKKRKKEGGVGGRESRIPVVSWGKT